jgi:CheY-like chemotaxis protein
MEPQGAPIGNGHIRFAATVLVVDDEPDMLDNVARILRRGAYACRTAPNGREALALVEQHRPDLILTDLRMPGMDGLVLLRAIKRLSPPTPVVIFSGYSSEATAQEALEAGAAAFVGKPFNGAQLLQAARRSLGEPDQEPPGSPR